MHLNFNSIMRSQCRPIIVRQNSANRRCPNASSKSIRGLGKTILQKTFHFRMPRCSCSVKWKLWLWIRISTRGSLRLQRRPGHQSGPLCGWNIRYSQRHFIRCLLHKLKAHRTWTVLCSEELREMSHCQLVGSLWDVTVPVTKYRPALHMFNNSKTTCSTQALQAKHETVLPDRDLAKL